MKACELYLVLPSIHYVLEAEELLQEAGIACDLRPMPRTISSNCGMCLVSSRQELPRIRKALDRMAGEAELAIFIKETPTAFRRL